MLFLIYKILPPPLNHAEGRKENTGKVKEKYVYNNCLKQNILSVQEVLTQYINNLLYYLNYSRLLGPYIKRVHLSHDSQGGRLWSPAHEYIMVRDLTLSQTFIIRKKVQCPAVLSAIMTIFAKAKF